MKYRYTTILTILVSFMCFSCSFSPNGNNGGEIPEEETKEKTREEIYSEATFNIRESIPLLTINTENEDSSFATVPTMYNKWDYTSCNISLTNCEEDYQIEDVECNVKVRGNATANYEKKPFRLKFAKKRNLLGLNQGQKYKNWVLLADYKDCSLQRNALSFLFGRQLLETDGYYCSDSCPVEVNINGTYWGMYTLCEYQQINEGRVSINEVEEDYEGNDIGYFVEYDGYAPNEEDQNSIFQISYHNNGSFKNRNGQYTTNSSRQNGYFTLKSDYYNVNQVQYIKGYLENVYNIIYEAVMNNAFYEFDENYQNIYLSSTLTSAEETIKNVVDVQSLVDTYLLNEVACDLDVDWSSFFMSIDHSELGDHKLRFEAPWDFDSAFAIRSIMENPSGGLYAANNGNSGANAWLVILQNQNWFQEMIKSKWAELRKYGTFKTCLDMLNTYTNNYSSWYNTNFNKYTSCFGTMGGEHNGTLSSYTTQKEWSDYLYNWFHKRCNYLNTIFGDNKDVLSSYEEEEEEKDTSLYRFEAENGYDFTGSISAIYSSSASNSYCLGDFFRNSSAGFSLDFNASEAGSGTLYINVCKRTYEHYLKDWYSISLNSNELNMNSELIPGAGSYDGISNFYKIEVCQIDFNKGINTIRLDAVGESSSNVDYLEIESAINLYN